MRLFAHFASLQIFRHVQILSATGPLFIDLHQKSFHKANSGCTVWGNTDDPITSSNLLIQTLQAVGGSKPFPVLLRKEPWWRWWSTACRPGRLRGSRKRCAEQRFPGPLCRICVRNWIRWCLPGMPSLAGHTVSLRYCRCDGTEGTGRRTCACTRYSPRHRGE
jgi:hypothetical protein